MNYKIRTTVSIVAGVFPFLFLRSFIISDPKNSTDIFKAVVAATAGGILAGLTSYLIMWLSEIVSNFRKTSGNINGKK